MGIDYPQSFVTSLNNALRAFRDLRGGRPRECGGQVALRVALSVSKSLPVARNRQTDTNFVAISRFAATF